MKKSDKLFLDLSLQLLALCENNNIDKKKYFIQSSDARMGKLYGIFEHMNLETGTIQLSGPGRFYTYTELTAWMDGYSAAKSLNFFK